MPGGRTCSRVRLAREEVRGGVTNAIDEEESVEVIHLVLEAARLHPVGVDAQHTTGPRLDSLHDDVGPARDVARQMRHAEAPFAEHQFQDRVRRLARGM